MRIKNNDRYFDGLEGLAEKVMATFPEDMTEKQKEIGAMMALGFSQGEIASLLPITKSTVKDHMQAVVSKLGLSTARRTPAYVIQKILGGGDGF